MLPSMIRALWPGCSAPCFQAWLQDWLGAAGPGPLLQPVLPRGHNFFAGREALQNDGLIIILLTDPDVAHFGFVAIADDEGVEAVRSVLDGILRYDGHVLQCLHQQSGRDRQPGPQDVVVVLEGRFMLMVPLA
jgi:hypothetical protein